MCIVKIKASNLKSTLTSNVEYLVSVASRREIKHDDSVFCNTFLWNVFFCHTNYCNRKSV